MVRINGDYTIAQGASELLSEEGYTETALDGCFVEERGDFLAHVQVLALGALMSSICAQTP